MEIKNLLVKADNILDYVPGVSSITNLVDLFEMAVILPQLKPEEVKNDHYWKHLDQKSAARCFFLLIPFFGNLFVGLWDFAHKKYDDPKEILDDLAKGDHYKILFASKDLLRDPEFMLEAYRLSPIVKLEDESLLKNPDFMLEALKISQKRSKINMINRHLLEIASEELKTDPDFMFKVVELNPTYIPYAQIDSVLTNNKEFMLRLALIRPTTAENASDALKNDPTFFYEALEKGVHPKILLDASDQLHSDPDFIDKVCNLHLEARSFCVKNMTKEQFDKYFPNDEKAASS